tara:strand:- start:203 stop:907 length:705 start_codon:yes stop_codon:yes gene_type:complete
MMANYRAGAQNWQAAGGPSTIANGCGLTNESNVSAGGNIQLNLPAQTMSSLATATGADSAASVVMLDRLMVSLPNKRGIGQGDHIRGDLAITPNCSDMFRPSRSFDVSNVLNPGALAVLGAGTTMPTGGLSTSTATTAMISAGQGGNNLGANHASQGVPYSTGFTGDATFGANYAAAQQGLAPFSAVMASQNSVAMPGGPGEAVVGSMFGAEQGPSLLSASSYLAQPGAINAAS